MCRVELTKLEDKLQLPDKQKVPDKQELLRLEMQDVPNTDSKTARRLYV